ncbi:MAG: cytochrome ubiquinol oxidase subunit I [Planctomycetes bacterium]|nr:cytochrome ubiquinol oxidase subunit I [Planctomycetota bacterium]
MNYPFWDVPIIGSVWVVGMIAIFHVTISHFAIGGAFYLLMAKRKAHRENRQDWLEVIRKHARFFLILTAVLGAVSGIGIWFAIGLAQPQGTSALIHNFVFGWAIEWCFFIIEVIALIVFYYFWDRLDHKTHMAVGWVYAIAAFMSLVIINGILTFMLTPGATWLATAEADISNAPHDFWAAFFNPGYFPSLILRTLVCIAIAGVWAMVTAGRIDGHAQPKLKGEIIRWSTRWLVPGFVLMPIVFFWYISTIPDTQRELLNFGVDSAGQGAFTLVTRIGLMIVMSSATILGVIYFLGYRNPTDFGPGHGWAVVVLALLVTGSAEYARELIRKPYVVRAYMYANAVRAADVERFNVDGYLSDSPWASDAERARWAKMDKELKMVPVSDDAAAPSYPAIAKASPEDWEAHLKRGQMMARGQCMNCHTNDGYRPLRKLLLGRDRESVANFVRMLHKYEDGLSYAAYMPPVVGTEGEVEALIDHLATLVSPKAQK